MCSLKHDALFSEALNLRERTITDFVAKKPGVTKQKVVDALDGKYSRVVIFDTIKDLEKYDIIRIQKNKPNSRIHKLYVNKNSQILIEMDRLSQFEKAMTDLLEKIKKEEDTRLRQQITSDRETLTERIKKVSETLGISSNEHEKIVSTDLGNQFIKQINDILNEPNSREIIYKQIAYSEMRFRSLRIYWKVLQAYSIEALFIWPSQLKNKTYTNKLIQSVLTSLIDIQVKMAQIIDDTSSIQNRSTEKGGFRIDDIYKQLIEHLKKEISFLQFSFEEESKFFRDHGLGKEIENVLDSVYPITKDLFTNVSDNSKN
jgi:hypothetical protein